MCKKLVSTFAVAGLLAGMAGPALSAAEFKHSGCSQAAKMRFPTDQEGRKQFKHWCKDQWKIYKASQKADA
jgi:hypothetical protein